MSTDVDKDIQASLPFLEQVLAREGKEQDLKDIREGSHKIVVVSGQYDSIESILSTLGVPYNLVSEFEVNNGDYSFEEADAVFINCCGGHLNDKGLSKVKEYVDKGGKLITTDWAVKNVIEKVFPGTIRFNGRQTSDDVVVVEPQGDLGKRLIGLDYEGAEPKWWLEGSSYIIEIENKAIVAPVIMSEELKEKYGSPYVAVVFPYGKGAVMHFVSHLKAQRTEARNKRDLGDAEDFSRLTKTVVYGKVPKNVTVSGLETGYSSLKTVFTIINEPTAGLKHQTPSGGKSYSLEVVARKYSGVHFNGCEKSGGLSAEYNLAKGPVTIGRGSRNSIDLNNSGVSRIHAEIYQDGKKCFIRDLNSANGTYLNNKEVTTAELPKSGTIEIGIGTIDFKLL